MKENLEKIQLIETKIKEVESTLTLWIKNIKTYQKKLEEITNQLNIVKKKIK